MRVEFLPKLQGESRNYTFPFGTLLALAETISTAVTTAVVYSGTDASPSSIVNGTATINGPNVTQNFQQGVTGCIYQVKCAVTTSLGQTLNCVAFLAVIPDIT